MRIFEFNMRTANSLIIIFILLLTASCSGSKILRSNYATANELLYTEAANDQEDFLKAHTVDGELYIFNRGWQIDTINGLLKGKADHYNYNRKKIGSKETALPLDRIAIYETNKTPKDLHTERVSALAVIAGLNAALGVFCISNPKSCFGSCPTFYLDPYADVRYADAEGFSNAIAPSLEYTDIDALPAVQKGGTCFTLTMKNEALETHCVNSLQLFALPAPDDMEVYHTTSDGFVVAHPAKGPISAITELADISDLLTERDREEYFREADSIDLAEKEEILLQFSVDDPDAAYGLVVTFRQSLMTTYLIYSAFDYMGPYAGEMLSNIQQDAAMRDLVMEGLMQELGNIEVFVQDNNGKWLPAGSFHETGPIAFNTQLLRLDDLPPNLETVAVKLQLTKGMWRIDQAGLAKLGAEIEAIPLSPSEMTRNGQDYLEGVERMKDSSAYIVSLPGDVFTIGFDLPDAEKEYALFLSARGYYLEWMREEWLASSDLKRLRKMLKRPSAYLKEEASQYKIYEDEMESLFWNSRIPTGKNSEHEN